MDGLPGTNNAQETMKAEKITPLKKMVGPLAPTHYRNSNAGYGIEHLLLAAIFGAIFAVLVLLYGTSIAEALRSTLPVDLESVRVAPFEKLGS